MPTLLFSTVSQDATPTTRMRSTGMRRCWRCNSKANRWVAEMYRFGQPVWQCKSDLGCAQRVNKRLTKRLAAFKRLMAAGIDLASLVANKRGAMTVEERERADALYDRWGEALIELKREDR